MSSTPQPTLASLVRLKPDVLFQDIQGEAVLLDLHSGTYYGLNPLGTRIWQLLAQHKTLSAIAAVIRNEYDVAERQCTADLLELVGDLAQRGLIDLT